MVYIEFYNKSKNYTKDKKEFSTYLEAEKWGRKNLDNFNLDMMQGFEENKK